MLLLILSLCCTFVYCKYIISVSATYTSIDKPLFAAVITCGCYVVVLGSTIYASVHTFHGEDTGECDYAATPIVTVAFSYALLLLFGCVYCVCTLLSCYFEIVNKLCFSLY